MEETYVKMSYKRAKFKVDEIRRSLTSRPAKGADGNRVRDEHGRDKYEVCEMRTVVMSPVYDSDPGSENRKFWEASPSGKLELGCVNLEAADRFELGKAYYIDFTPVEDR